ncbi:uncharacterized protein LOC119271961 [Triticum dicoccoides]|uniref:uncharacterized protein LOC119271961 n=1 Tax=Triticum dicoccoides TaxID=85692 RepID=UPI00188F61BC|nr:uncharacterized protein LOC119271961 [Triticum dicoccoides]
MAELCVAGLDSNEGESRLLAAHRPASLSLFFLSCPRRCSCLSIFLLRHLLLLLQHGAPPSPRSHIVVVELLLLLHGAPSSPGSKAATSRTTSHACYNGCGKPCYNGPWKSWNRAAEKLRPGPQKLQRVCRDKAGTGVHICWNQCQDLLEPAIKFAGIAVARASFYCNQPWRFAGMNFLHFEGDHGDHSDHDSQFEDGSATPTSTSLLQAPWLHFCYKRRCHFLLRNTGDEQIATTGEFVFPWDER